MTNYRHENGSNMMRFVRVLALLGFAIAALTLAGASFQAQAQATATVRSATAVPHAGGTHVYLLRGWLDVFSTGMNELTVKLNRRGIRATVHGHMEYYSLADSIASQYRSGVQENIVIIGHSLGANAAIQMAARLGDHDVPVRLVITYDPTAVQYVTGNVVRLVNFYQSNNGWGVRVARGPSFRGTLHNIDLADTGLDHVSIDKSNKLHLQSIEYIQFQGGTFTGDSLVMLTHDRAGRFVIE
jgi:hypothetical protein